MIGRGYFQANAIGGEFYFSNFRFFVDLGAALAGMIEKQFIELGSRDLVGAIASRFKAVFKIELRAPASAGGHDLASVFWDERAIELFTDAKSIESLNAKRKKRFANMKARKFLAFENNDAASSSCEQRGGRASSWAAADDGDVIYFTAHAGFILARFAAKQRAMECAGKAERRRRFGRNAGPLSTRHVQFPRCQHSFLGGMCFCASPFSMWGVTTVKTLIC